MKPISIEDINDFKGFDYHYVIQSNFVKDKEHRIVNGVIEGFNNEKYLKYAVYNGEELLNEISKCGKKLYEILKENLVINTSEYLQEYVKKNKNIEIIGIPFGIREDKFFMFYSNETQNNRVLNIIKNWCEKYGFPTRPKDVDIEIIKNENEIKNVVNAYADILPRKQTTPENIKLDIGTLDEIIIKFLIVYIANDLWVCLNKVNSGINNLRKCNRKIKHQSEVSTSELYNYKYRLNKNIDELNKSVLILNKLNKVVSLELKHQMKEIREIEQQLIKIRKDFSLQLSEYCYKFGGNLTKQIIYNENKEKFFSIIVSDNVLDLAWNILISKNCAQIGYIKPIICKDCDKEFTPTGHHQFSCDECTKKNKRKTTNYDNLRKNYKLQASEIINNPDVPKEDKDILQKDIIDKQYRYVSVKQHYLLKKYEKLLKELHSL